MRVSNFTVSPILLARYLLIITSAVLILIGAGTFVRANSNPEQTTLYSVLMFSDAAAMLIFGLFINVQQKQIYWLAVIVVALNMFLTVFDQFGVINFLFALFNAITLFILLVSRKEFI